MSRVEKTAGDWRRQFEQFVQPRSPDRYRLYRRIVEVLRDDNAFWARVARLPSTEAQDEWLHHLFFAAVHNLVLLYPAEPLARYFPSSPSFIPNADQNAFAAVLRSFLAGRWDEISHLVQTREVQINKLGRIATFAPFLLHYAGGTAASFVEVGSSIGLGLMWPHLAVHFRGHGSIESDYPEASLLTTVRGGPSLPVQGKIVPPAFLAGIELKPLAIDDPSDTRWLRALLGPNDGGGRSLLELGLRLLREHPPRIIAGSVERVLPEVLAQVRTRTLIVYHAMVMQDLRKQGTEPEFHRQLREASRRHTVHEIGVEWIERWDGTGVRPVEVRCCTWSPDGPVNERFASTDDGADGRFLEFRDPPAPR